MPAKKTVFATISKRAVIEPVAPFNFDGTVYVPHYFRTRDFKWKPNVMWQVVNLEKTLVGIKMQNKGISDKPKLQLSMYSEAQLSVELVDKIIKEMTWRYGLNEDLNGFFSEFRYDSFLKPAFKRLRGMRINCANSLYELLIISIVLQNATVKRTIQMMNRMFNAYGKKLQFSGQALTAYWDPYDLHETSEEELRFLKVGYRAKMIKQISDAFTNNEVNEYALRKKNTEEAEKELMKLYGVGPATAQIVLTGYLRKYDTFSLKGRFWEQKILSRALFNQKLVPTERIVEEFECRYGKWRNLAFHYIFTNLFWKHREKPILWLQKEIRI